MCDLKDLDDDVKKAAGETSEILGTGTNELLVTALETIQLLVAAGNSFQMIDVKPLEEGAHVLAS